MCVCVCVCVYYLLENSLKALRPNKRKPNFYYSVFITAVNRGIFCRGTQKTAQTEYSREMSRNVFGRNRE